MSLRKVSYVAKHKFLYSNTILGMISPTPYMPSKELIEMLHIGNKRTNAIQMATVDGFAANLVCTIVREL